MSQSSGKNRAAYLNARSYIVSEQHAAPLDKGESVGRVELRGGVGDQLRFLCQAFRDDYDSLIGLFPLFLFDGLAHIGPRFCVIAGVEARRVELVAVPRAIWQALLCDEFPFAFDEQAIDLGDRSRGQGGAAIGIGVLQSLAVLRGAMRDGIGGVFERREVLVGRNFFLLRRTLRFLSISTRGGNTFG